MRALLAILICVAGSLSVAQPAAQDQILQTTRDWLQSVSKGDRASLNKIMDARCLITTPVGDVLTKDRLVPDDETRAVQTLPLMDLDAPMVRVYGDTAVLMSHLKPGANDGPQMSGTFVYHKQESSWKLVALHLAARK
jgi:ketosteroid isomerase-like protein